MPAKHENGLSLSYNVHTIGLLHMDEEQGFPLARAEAAAWSPSNGQRGKFLYLKGSGIRLTPSMNFVFII